jgi:DNA-binding IclR family transcriptional regulator
MSMVEHGSAEETASATSSLNRALQLIYAVAESPSPGVGVSALARELSLPKAVVHRIVKVLSADGLLAFDLDTKRYTLGPGALTVGLAALRQLDVPAVARPYLERLVEQTGETATLSVRQGWSRLYIDQALSPQAVRMWVVLGKPYPLHAGASSKAILAVLNDQEIDEYLRHHDLEAATESTVTDRSALKDEIGTIREHGYAVSLGERQPGAGSVAAAIRHADGSVFGSISVCGPVARFDEELRRRYGWLVAATASELSAAIGYRPPAGS